MRELRAAVNTLCGVSFWRDPLALPTSASRELFITVAMQHREA
jgi:hypothetical protein